jgi:hypothetical protein
MAPVAQNPETLTLAVVTKLQSITVENGYDSDVASVVRVPLNLDQPPTTMPILTVVVTGQDNVRQSGHQQLYKARLRLAIGGMVEATSELLEADRSIAINRLLADTINALNDDPRFALGVHVDSVLGNAEVVVDGDRSLAYFALPFEITYHFARRTL